jgi:hypothetical protein
VHNDDTVPDSDPSSDSKIDAESKEESEEDVTQPIKHTPKRVLLSPTQILNDNPRFSFKSQVETSEEDESIDKSDNGHAEVMTDKCDTHKESGHKSFLHYLRRRTREEFEEDMVSSDGLLARPSKRSRV